MLLNDLKLSFGAVSGESRTYRSNEIDELRHNDTLAD